LIPNGYVGWVRIDFKIKHSSALPVEDGYYLVKLPTQGHIQTSSDIEYGWATDEYYYYSNGKREVLASTGWGEGGMIWGQFNGSRQGPDEPPYQYFFVGTEEQFKEFGVTLKGENGRPLVGPVSSRGEIVKFGTDDLTSPTALK
jgi:hypothetical protein